MKKVNELRLKEQATPTQEPIAKIRQGRLGFPILEFIKPFRYATYSTPNAEIPLYTHPVKEQGNPVATVAYFSAHENMTTIETVEPLPCGTKLYTHPILNIDEDTAYELAHDFGIFEGDILGFAKAILKKASEK